MHRAAQRRGGAPACPPPPPPPCRPDAAGVRISQAAARCGGVRPVWPGRAGAARYWRRCVCLEIAAHALPRSRRVFRVERSRAASFAPETAVSALARVGEAHTQGRGRGLRKSEAGFCRADQTWSTSWQPAHVSGVCLEPMALPFGQTASYVRRDVAKLPKPCTRLGLPRRRDQFVERPGRLSCSAASAQCRREGLVRGLQTLSSATARPSGLVKPAPWHCHGIA